MEYKLGEIIEYKGDFLRIKLSESSENACTGCYFRSGNTCTCDYSKIGFCAASNRSDNNNVIFSRIVRREPKQGDIVEYKDDEYLAEEVPKNEWVKERINITKDKDYRKLYEKLVNEINSQYEYWHKKIFVHYSIDSEVRSSEYLRLQAFIIGIEKEL